MKIIGLDLFGCSDQETGFCLMTDIIEEITVVKNDALVEKVLSQNPDVIVIASPLSFPEKGNWRKAEEELNKRNIKFVAPKGLLVMEQIVMRGITLKETFQKKGILVIETSSGAFYDSLKVPRVKNYLEVKRFLKIYDFNMLRRDYQQCEVDSSIAAFIGRLFLETRVEFIGDENEGQIVLAKFKA